MTIPMTRSPSTARKRIYALLRCIIRSSALVALCGALHFSWGSLLFRSSFLTLLPWGLTAFGQSVFCAHPRYGCERSDRCKGPLVFLRSSPDYRPSSRRTFFQKAQAWPRQLSRRRARSRGRLLKIISKTNVKVLDPRGADSLFAPLQFAAWRHQRELLRSPSRRV